ncbi:site-specific integrase [Pseudomonas aeruginosa]|nr:site-specific integrase [Pseudomonas aeruginosa]HCF3403484.1 site-specific integrase [Pseudomonas aeruginosa]
MHLIWSTEDYVLHGRRVPGFPILLYDSMESCIPANSFFRSYLMRAQIESESSWKGAGQAIYDYFSFLQVHNLDWKLVDRGEAKSLLYAYRDYCYSEHNLTVNTVRNRLLYICKFYEHALKNKMIGKLPFDFEMRHSDAPSQFFDHLESTGNRTKANDAMPRAHKKTPKYLTRDGAKALIEASDNIHHRTMIKFALQTGLRRVELATFPVAYIKQALLHPGNSLNVLLRLDPSDGHGMKTKRNTQRDLWVSRKLVMAIDRYITQRRGERAHLGKSDNGRLFVNQDGNPYAEDGKALGKIVRDIGKKIGLHVNPHMLRHTYATHTLVSLRRMGGDIDPIVFLSRQMGHSSINTTMIYSHLVDDMVDNAVIEYDEELSTME